MIEKIPISNIVRIDNITNKKKAKLIYKDNQNQLKEMLLSSAEKGWLKKYPNNSIICKLYYISNGVHYIANRYRSPEDRNSRTLTFFLSSDNYIQFYSDETNDIKFTQTINLLHSNNWGTLDTT